jgi:hypothetical protein
VGDRTCRRAGVRACDCTHVIAAPAAHASVKVAQTPKVGADRRVARRGWVWVGGGGEPLAGSMCAMSSRTELASLRSATAVAEPPPRTCA